MRSLPECFGPKDLPLWNFQPTLDAGPYSLVNRSALAVNVRPCGGSRLFLKQPCPISSYARVAPSAHPTMRRLSPGDRCKDQLDLWTVTNGKPHSAGG